MPLSAPLLAGLNSGDPRRRPASPRLRSAVSLTTPTSGLPPPSKRCDRETVLPARVVGLSRQSARGWAPSTLFARVVGYRIRGSNPAYGNTLWSSRGLASGRRERARWFVFTARLAPVCWNAGTPSQRDYTHPLSGYLTGGTDCSVDPPTIRVISTSAQDNFMQVHLNK